MYEIILQSTLAGLATVLGALIVISYGHPGEKTLSILFGFAGGVMTAVIIFDLIPSALDFGNVFSTAAGFLLGLILMRLLNAVISGFTNSRSVNSLAGSGKFLKMGYLIATGIALHNLPEGMAIAAGYAAQENLGLLLVLALGTHNIPEGVATAAPLAKGGMPKARIVLICLLTSIFTPLGTWLGLLMVSVSRHLISLLLALAGGAMTFIVKNELLPEARRHYPLNAGFGLLIGFLLFLLFQLAC